MSGTVERVSQGAAAGAVNGGALVVGMDVRPSWVSLLPVATAAARRRTGFLVWNERRPGNIAEPRTTSSARKGSYPSSAYPLSANRGPDRIAPESVASGPTTRDPPSPPVLQHAADVVAVVGLVDDEVLDLHLEGDLAGGLGLSMRRV